jgi:hypothetical protein
VSAEWPPSGCFYDLNKLRPTGRDSKPNSLHKTRSGSKGLFSMMPMLLWREWLFAGTVLTSPSSPTGAAGHLVLEGAERSGCSAHSTSRPLPPPSRKRAVASSRTRTIRNTASQRKSPPASPQNSLLELDLCLVGANFLLIPFSPPLEQATLPSREQIVLRLEQRRSSDAISRQTKPRAEPGGAPIAGDR